MVTRLLAGRDLATLSLKTLRKEAEQRLGVPEGCLAARKGEVKAAALAYVEQNKSSDSAAASAPDETSIDANNPKTGTTARAVVGAERHSSVAEGSATDSPIEQAESEAACQGGPYSSGESGWSRRKLQHPTFTFYSLNE